MFPSLLPVRACVCVCVCVCVNCASAHGCPFIAIDRGSVFLCLWSAVVGCCILLLHCSGAKSELWTPWSDGQNALLSARVCICVCALCVCLFTAAIVCFRKRRGHCCAHAESFVESQWPRFVFFSLVLVALRIIAACGGAFICLSRDTSGVMHVFYL